MTEKKIPVSIYAEMTPNPKTMKFVADKMLIESEDMVEYRSAAEANGASSLATALFNFPFVTGVFIAANFVTVVKNDSIEWDDITMELRSFIQEFVMNNSSLVQKLPNYQEENKNSDEPANYEDSKPSSAVEEKIIDILDEYIRPAVANDGGAINFKSFDNGIVTVILRGSCSGCPSATQTLKGGVESLLKQMLPEVSEVVAEEL